MRAPLALALTLALVMAGCAPPLLRPQAGSTVILSPEATAPAQSTPSSAVVGRRQQRTPRPIATAASNVAPQVANVATPGAIIATPAANVAATAPPPPTLNGLLDSVMIEPPDNYGIVVEDLASGARVGVNEAQSFPSASLYKLGVAWTVLRQVDAGTLRLDQQIKIGDEDAVEPEPYGGFGVGDTPSLQDALDEMLSISSNAAAHALMRLLGRDIFTAEMDRIGLNQTRVPDDGLAVTSADDIAHLLRLLATSSELSSESRGLMTQAMSNIAPPDALRDALPTSVDIFEKTGNLDDASNVAALLQTPRGSVIFVVVDTGVDPGDARAVIARAAEAVYQALLQ